MGMALKGWGAGSRHRVMAPLTDPESEVASVSDTGEGATPLQAKTFAENGHDEEEMAERLMSILHLDGWTTDIEGSKESISGSDTSASHLDIRSSSHLFSGPRPPKTPAISSNRFSFISPVKWFWSSPVDDSAEGRKGRHSPHVGFADSQNGSSQQMINNLHTEAIRLRRKRKKDKKRANGAASSLHSIAGNCLDSSSSHYEETRKFWTDFVIPCWDIALLDEEVKGVWREGGLPASVRRVLWPLAIGNDLKVTEELFEICCSQAKAHTKLVEYENCYHRVKSLRNRSMSLKQALEQDVVRTTASPLHEVLEVDVQMQTDVQTVLAAYAQYRPDVGYVQGMSYIVTVLLVYLEPPLAFVCFANLVSQDIFLSFFRMGSNRRQRFFDTATKLTRERLPTLAKHLAILGVEPDMYMTEWLVTIFARSLPLECVVELWDYYLLDGVSVLYRALLAILEVLEKNLLAAEDVSEALQLLKNSVRFMSKEEFFEAYEINHVSFRAVERLSKLATECYSPRPIQVSETKMAMQVGSASPQRIVATLKPISPWNSP